MPHICTRCNSSFDSGEDILKGCPVCGWKKFMFMKRRPEDVDDRASGQLISQAMGVKIPPRKTAQGVPESRGASEGVAARPPPARQVPEKVPGKLSPVPGASNVSEGRSQADKLESIKIMQPGSYELNLPSLFEREELIMAAKDGTYFIDLSSAFKKGKKE
ncbi:MAG: Zn-ribbon domain-containing protein [Methanotrichaceae archaeon]|nr:Zn-ribbon domain-containing protein [Methanotrichaceae archaeon]